MLELIDNNMFRYPYCWFRDFHGCQDEPASSPPGLPPIEPSAAAGGDPMIKIHKGESSFAFSYESFIYTVAAACIGYLTAKLFAWFVNNEFCMRSLKVVVTSIGTTMSQMSFSNLVAEKDSNVSTAAGDGEDASLLTAVQQERQHFMHSGHERRQSRERSIHSSVSRVAFAPSTVFDEGSRRGRVSEETPRGRSKPIIIRIQEQSSPSWSRIIELHQYPRGNTVPCQNPWGMRLECLLRVMKIPHTVVIESGLNEEKQPWLIYRDNHGRAQSMLKPMDGNSSRVIEFLCPLFPEAQTRLNDRRKDVPAHFLTALVEYHLIPTLVKILQFNKLPEDESELIELKKGLHDDLTSLSAALSDKAYFLGEKISEVDCTIFAALAQIVWAKPELLLQPLIFRHSNLVNYCQTMKAAVWPDWDHNVNAASEEQSYLSQPESELE